MSFKQISILGAVGLSAAGVLVWAAGVLGAGAPSNVKNVQADFTNGVLHVTWDAATDPAGISFYRVYFSRASIINNGGNYDDFEQTASPQTSYTFLKPPYTGKTLYFSVLAVNSAGMESDAFESEASVVIPAGASTPSSTPASSSSSAVASSAGAPSSVSSSKATTPSSSSSSSASSTPASSSAKPPITLSLVSVTARSTTGVMLTFSQPLSARVAVQPDYFSISDGSGNKLAIQATQVIGVSIQLKTAAQLPRLYILSFLHSITAADGQILALPLPQVGFLGSTPTQSTPTVLRSSSPARSSSSSTMSASAAASVPVPSTPVAPDTRPPEDARNLQLKPALQDDGTYTVEAVWQGSLNTAKDLKNYEIYTTFDGKSFIPNSQEKPQTHSIKFVEVTPGVFGVKLTAKDDAGNESRGIQKIINLPTSGIGILSIALISGAVAGRRVKRRKDQL